ncbi:Uncharacterized protein TCM_036160 [Theobroma cacao]|uniref:Uncharacterized protein n=1 Tax=Theobroma cacao TaxID=3641 RepID=A0A061FIV1_THECC|nr:Uncharacterized protein TCM_036160 [Theobroma cacao]
METFIRKKPMDEIFVGETSMKQWVKESLYTGTIGAIDSNLLQNEEEHLMAKANCISSIMKLALDCSVELPEEWKDMKDVVSILKKIKIKYLNNVRRAYYGENGRLADGRKFLVKAAKGRKENKVKKGEVLSQKNDEKKIRAIISTLKSYKDVLVNKEEHEKCEALTCSQNPLKVADLENFVEIEWVGELPWDYMEWVERNAIRTLIKEFVPRGVESTLFMENI